MSTKGTKSSNISVPADPDPTPLAAADPSPEVQSAARETKKRTIKSYGRQQTVIAGNTAVDNNGKKTILGG